MWRKLEWSILWQKYRAYFCSALGIACFLAAGFLVQSLPSVKEKLMTSEKPTPSRNAKPVVLGAAKRAPEEAKASSVESSVQDAPADEPLEPPERWTVRRSAGTTNGVEIFGVRGDAPESTAGRSDEWFLYITGGVRKPGVYKLPSGARLFQLVEAAGGLSNFADPVAVNMAAPLADGQHIHVPKKDERFSENSTVIVEPIVIPGAPRYSQTGLVDINRATEAELVALKGIGPVLAKSIVEYRQRNGRFKTLDDLLQVRGIGAKKLEGFRKNATVSP